MKRIVLASLLLAAVSAFAAEPAPGIAYYSNGHQEYLSFEQIRTLPLDTLRAKLQDISLHTEWIRSFAEPPFNNPTLYADVVRETIEQAEDVESTLRASKRDPLVCLGTEDTSAAALACGLEAERANADIEARVRSVDDFKRAFEALKSQQP